MPGRPFPKGVSGNPAGRPKLATLRELFVGDRETVHDALMHLAQHAESESIRLATLIEIANRSDGKPKESKES